MRAAEEQVNALGRKLVAANAQLGMIERQTTLQIEQAAAALREAEARLRRTRAGLQQAERDAQRAAVLVAKELIAPQEGEHARLHAEVEEHAVKEAEEALVSSEKQLALARVGLQQIEIVRAERDALARQRAQADAQLAEQRSHVADFAVRSPIDGRVLTRTVERGERVDAGTPLFTLVDLDRLYVKIYVPEPSIGKVALGQEARVYVDAYPGRAFPARVSRVSQEAEFTPKNVETREERVKLVFAVEVALSENPGGVLKPGMPADAVIRWQARRAVEVSGAGRASTAHVPVPDLPARPHPGGAGRLLRRVAGRSVRPDRSRRRRQDQRAPDAGRRAPRRLPARPAWPAWT